MRARCSLPRHQFPCCWKPSRERERERDRKGEILLFLGRKELEGPAFKRGIVGLGLRAGQARVLLLICRKCLHKYLIPLTAGRRFLGRWEGEAPSHRGPFSFLPALFISFPHPLHPAFSFSFILSFLPTSSRSWEALIPGLFSFLYRHLPLGSGVQGAPWGSRHTG